jgi:hypothetical protein
VTDDELLKLKLEIAKLQIELSPLSRFASILWPVVASLLTIVLSIATGCNAYWNSRREEQHKVEDHRLKIEDQIASAAKDTTDQELPRRVAGMWRLNQYWNDPDAEVLVSATVSSLLGGRSAAGVECQAAEVIGNAITKRGFSDGNESARSQRIATMLYGNRDGRIGFVTNQNLLLKAQNLESKLSATDFRDFTKHRCYLDPDANALDATREAIRKNWEYLRNVNLNNTDLSGIYLYEADLDGATAVNAKLTSADFRCANLSGVDLTGSKLESADFYLANVHDLKPDGLRKYLISKGALDWTDVHTWEKFRANDFYVDNLGHPITDGTPNPNSDTRPCLDLRSQKNKELVPPANLQTD